MELQPLLRITLWNFYKGLISQIPDFESKAQCVFQSTLSVAFNVKPYGFESKIGQLLLYSPVDLMIASPPPDGRLIAAFDIKEPNRHDPSENIKRSFLNGEGIFYDVIDQGDLLTRSKTIAATIQKFINTQARAQRITDSLIVHKGELKVIEAARKKLPSNYICLQEVALSSIVRGTLDDLVKDHNFHKHKIANTRPNCLLNKRVDTVIATEPPNSIPVAVIEYDGKEHRTNPQKAENDRTGDAALNSVGIHIFRLRSDIFNEKGHADVTKFKFDFITYITRILAMQQGGSNWLIETMHSQIIREAEAIRGHSPFTADNVNHYVNRIHALLKYRESMHDDILHKFEMVTSERDKLMEWQEEFHSHKEYDDLMDENYAADYAAYLRTDGEITKVTPIFTKDISFENIEGFITGKIKLIPGIILQCGGIDECFIQQSEELHMHVVGLDDGLIEKITKDFLSEYLTENAVKFIATNRIVIADAIEKGIPAKHESERRAHIEIVKKKLANKTNNEVDQYFINNFTRIYLHMPPDRRYASTIRDIHNVYPIGKNRDRVVRLINKEYTKIFNEMPPR